MPTDLEITIGLTQADEPTHITRGRIAYAMDLLILEIAQSVPGIARHTAPADCDQ